MAKMRVYQMAKELGVEAATLIDLLKREGEFVRSASSTVDAPRVRWLREAVAERGRRSPTGASAALDPIDGRASNAVVPTMLVTTSCDRRWHPARPVPPGTGMRVTGCACGQEIHGPDKLLEHRTNVPPNRPTPAPSSPPRPASDRTPQVPQPLPKTSATTKANKKGRKVKMPTPAPLPPGAVRISDLAVGLGVNARVIQAFLIDHGYTVGVRREVTPQAAQAVRDRWSSPTISSRPQVEALCAQLRHADTTAAREALRIGSYPEQYASPHEVVFWALPGTQQLIAATSAPHRLTIERLPAEAMLLLSEVTDFAGTCGGGGVRALSWRYLTGTANIQMTAWTDSDSAVRPLVELQTAVVDATEPWNLPHDDVRSLTARWWLILDRTQRAAPIVRGSHTQGTGGKNRGQQSETIFEPAPVGPEVSFREWTQHVDGNHRRASGWHGPAGEHLVRAHARLAHVGPGGKDREFRLVRAHARGGPHHAQPQRIPVTTVYVLNLDPQAQR